MAHYDQPWDVSSKSLVARCELPKGHGGYHREQGSRWLGNIPPPPPAARETAGLVQETRMCANCGKTKTASEPREEPLPECVGPDGLYACTFDMTLGEAVDYWRVRAHDLIAERQSLVARAEALAAGRRTAIHNSLEMADRADRANLRAEALAAELHTSNDRVLALKQERGEARLARDRAIQQRDALAAQVDAQRERVRQLEADRDEARDQRDDLAAQVADLTQQVEMLKETHDGLYETWAEARSRQLEAEVQVETLMRERDEQRATTRRYADALLLAWGGVCPPEWATTGDPMEMAETIRSCGDSMQAEIAAFAEQQAVARDALRAIVECRCPFSKDPLQHARNAVEFCQSTARAALEE